MKQTSSSKLERLAEKGWRICPTPEVPLHGVGAVKERSGVKMKDEGQEVPEFETVEDPEEEDEAVASMMDEEEERQSDCEENSKPVGSERRMDGWSSDDDSNIAARPNSLALEMKRVCDRRVLRVSIHVYHHHHKPQ